MDFLNFKSNEVSSWSPGQGENRTRLYCAYVFLYMLPILPDNYETTLDFLLFFSNFLIVRIFSLAPPSTSLLYCTDRFFKTISTLIQLKGIVSRDWGGLESILLDRKEVFISSATGYFLFLSAFSHRIFLNGRPSGASFQHS